MTHAELIARLSNLDGPDREVDAEICMCLLGFTRRNRMEAFPEQPIDWDYFDPYRNTIGPSSVMIPHLTASIDAAVSLAGRVLPGWRIENLCEWDAEVLRQRGPWMCDLMPRGKDFSSGISAKCSHAPTPAIAIIIAVLKAKEATHGE